MRIVKNKRALLTDILDRAMDELSDLEHDTQYLRLYVQYYDFTDNRTLSAIIEHKEHYSSSKFRYKMRDNDYTLFNRGTILDVDDIDWIAGKFSDIL